AGRLSQPQIAHRGAGHQHPTLGEPYRETYSHPLPRPSMQKLKVDLPYRLGFLPSRDGSRSRSGGGQRRNGTGVGGGARPPRPTLRRRPHGHGIYSISAAAVRIWHLVCFLPAERLKASVKRSHHIVKAEQPRNLGYMQLAVTKVHRGTNRQIAGQVLEVIQR